MSTKLGRIVLAGLLASVFAGPGSAQAEPTNAEIFEMLKAQQAEINELKGQQGVLKQEADDARAAANVAEQKLERTQAELAAVQADVTALPDVAAAGDEVTADPGIFGSVDLLFWQVEGGKEYDYAGVGGVVILDGFIGDVKTADWDNDEGFRGELGYRFGTGIDVVVRGVVFDTDGGDSVTIAGDPLRIYPLALPHVQDPMVLARHASVDLDLDFHQVDFEVGKWFSIGDDVELRPFAAVRYSDFEYDLGLRYCRQADCSGAQDSVEARTDWWGAGIIGGVEGKWSFLDRFSLFGRGAAGILGGEYDVKGNYDSANVQLGASEDGGTFVPVIEASIGLGVRLFEVADVAFDLEAGYEALSFIDSPTPWQGDGATLEPNDALCCRESANLADFEEETVTLHGGFLRLGVRY